LQVRKSSIKLQQLWHQVAIKNYQPVVVITDLI